MKKIAILPVFLFFVINSLFSQISKEKFSIHSSIEYGNNPAAGKYYSIRGIKMYCEIYGQGQPLLLIHGNGGSIKSFTNNIPYLAKKYKVIVADSRAQGKTIDLTDSLSFEMMADDLSALLDEMKIDSSYVIGWSDGGINALLLAVRHPQKVKKLVSTGANLWPDSTAILSSLWRDEKNTYESEKNKKGLSAQEKNSWKLFMLDWLQPNISLAQLKNIQCPSLIVGGDHDLINIEHTTLIYKNIPKAYLWILPNSSHGTLIDHSSLFNKTAADFFSTPYQQ